MRQLPIHGHNYRASALGGMCAGSIAALIAGCGGVSTTTNALRPTPASGPAIYGVNATALAVGASYEISGFGTTDNLTQFATGALASTAHPIPAITDPSTHTIPTGFPIGDTGGDQGSPMIPYIIGKAPTQVIFRAAISNGTNPSNNQVIPINQTSVVLTSTEVPALSQPLTFAPATTGPLANATYSTSAFTFPFSTTGLHHVSVSVADTSGQSSTTSFGVVALSQSDAAVYVNFVQAAGAKTDYQIQPGDTAVITGELSGAAQLSTAIGPSTGLTIQGATVYGTLILFASPGVHTLTVTPAAGGAPISQSVTLSAGEMTILNDDGTGNVVATNVP